MNRITRLLAIAGMGLGAAVALAGPAQAAGTGASHQAPVSAKADWGNDRVVSYFDSPGVCNTVGRIGEAQGRWDDYNCYYAGDGDWALSVSENDWDDWNRPFSISGHHFDGRWNNFRHTRGFGHRGHRHH
jgi:hypothetical protein